MMCTEAILVFALRPMNIIFRLIAVFPKPTVNHVRLRFVVHGINGLTGLLVPSHVVGVFKASHEHILGEILLEFLLLNCWSELARQVNLKSIIILFSCSVINMP